MLRRAVLALALSAALTGCGALGGSEDGPAQAGGTVEKPKIKVALISTIDLAPLHLANKKGYFKAEGLELEITTAPSSQATLAALISGQADLAFASYVPFFVAQDKKAADIKIVADSVSASPRSNMIVTKPGSAVRSVQDLAGKKIGVSALNTASHIMSMAAMKAAGVDQREVRWTPIPFPDMAAALSRGDVDAAYLPEPFITQAARTIGAVPVADVATGPTEDFPIAGYGTLAKFAAANPKTVTAFQHAMKKATDESADRAAVQPYVAEFSKVDQDTAALVTLPNFHSTLDARRLQRVPDQLLEFQVIGGRLDVGPMLAPQG
ncbi:ABC transporter substrate-binding protein [Amycolatopsis sp. cg5]|uniref:ABC transporter substrate-binding protein n=1 Tax=Amycolatopsis sp. cg5 TaxID=3238802 RepID=UPI003526139B